MSRLSTRAALLCAFILLPAARAQGLDVPPAEVAQRNAAATHAVGQAVALGMLRTECEVVLPGAERGTPGIARRWWERNSEDVVTARVWLDRVLTQTRRAGPAALEEAVQAQAAAAAAAAKAAAAVFNQQRPATGTCLSALQPFTLPRNDIKSAAPGTGGAQDLAATLRAIRGEPGYRVPPHLKVDFDTMVRYRAVASLEAAAAARRKGDGAAARAIYGDLANRGDGAAAVLRGLMHFSADMTVRDDGEAWRWFYVGWLLGDLDGLNAMGLMLRDGRGTTPEPRLAYAAFALVAETAGDRATRERARENAKQIETTVTLEERMTLACAPLGAFDLELRSRLTADVRNVEVRVAQAGRRLGQLAPGLAGRPLSCS